MKSIAKNMLARAGIGVYRVEETPMPARFIMEFFDKVRDPGGDEVARFLSFVATNARRSNAQLFQDLFVLHHLREKKGGYFVEFGATDGIVRSNSVLLEKEYGWKGILAEPGRNWHTALRSNRRVAIDTRCVWKTSNETFEFKECSDPELSTVASIDQSDNNTRAHADSYSVKTISLNDLLAENKAPSEIDYLSIDTEGSEYEILSAVDFSRWKFKVLTVEHNYVADKREKIFRILTGNGYRRVLDRFSMYDDWYIGAQCVL
jgi:FkbM family methyltransferase